MTGEDLYLVMGGVFMCLYAPWTLRKVYRALDRLEVARARGVEVTGTIVKVDHAIESKKFQPTFAYRTRAGSKSRPDHT